MAEEHQVRYQPLIRLFNSRITKHVFVWMLLAVILIMFEQSGSSFWFSISNTLILLAFFMAIVYFNIYYLIPSFLSRKSLAIYLILFTISCLILTPFRTLIFYLKFSGRPAMQEEVLNDQVSTFLSIFIIGAISTLAKILSDWLRSQRKMRELQTETMQSELKFLRSQVNPHFLFNTLNSLYALTLKKSDKAPEIVIKLSEIMRYMLYECNERTVPLEKEIKYMGNYIELEKLRHGKDADISFKCEGEVKNQKIAPLIFIPFFENSFKHGISNQLKKGYVHINLQVRDNETELDISNSKAPKAEENDDHSGGIGLENVKRRLHLLYPGKHQLKITEDEQQYNVHLEIKLTES
jgi:sensor histidine kinase YesM